VAFSRERSRTESQASGQIVDSLANYSEIKSFANFKFERLNLLKYLRILRKAESRDSKVRALIHLFLQFIAVSSVMMFVFVSIFMLKNDVIDTVSFIYANTLFMDISTSVFAMTGSITMPRGHTGSSILPWEPFRFPLRLLTNRRCCPSS
jgi:ABC-type transport system involved in Fe-S cluster assembly fused permease/ATPase subunit